LYRKHEGLSCETEVTQYTYIHIYTYIYIYICISRAFANVNLSENKSVVLAMHTVRAIRIFACGDAGKKTVDKSENSRADD
jgi:hypothetical protein